MCPAIHVYLVMLPLIRLSVLVVCWFPQCSSTIRQTIPMTPSSAKCTTTPDLSSKSQNLPLKSLSENSKRTLWCVLCCCWATFLRRLDCSYTVYNNQNSFVARFSLALTSLLGPDERSPSGFLQRLVLWGWASTRFEKEEHRSCRKNSCAIELFCKVRFALILDPRVLMPRI